MREQLTFNLSTENIVQNWIDDLLDRGQHYGHPELYAILQSTKESRVIHCSNLQLNKYEKLNIFN